MSYLEIAKIQWIVKNMILGNGGIPRKIVFLEMMPKECVCVCTQRYITYIHIWKYIKYKQDILNMYLYVYIIRALQGTQNIILHNKCSVSDGLLTFLSHLFNFCISLFYWIGNVKSFYTILHVCFPSDSRSPQIHVFESPRGIVLYIFII